MLLIATERAGSFEQLVGMHGTNTHTIPRECTGSDRTNRKRSGLGGVSSVFVWYAHHHIFKKRRDRRATTTCADRFQSHLSKC